MKERGCIHSVILSLSKETRAKTLAFPGNALNVSADQRRDYARTRL